MCSIRVVVVETTLEASWSRARRDDAPTAGVRARFFAPPTSARPPRASREASVSHSGVGGEVGAPRAVFGRRRASWRGQTLRCRGASVHSVSARPTRAHTHPRDPRDGDDSTRDAHDARGDGFDRPRRHRVAPPSAPRRLVPAAIVSAPRSDARRPSRTRPRDAPPPAADRRRDGRAVRRASAMPSLPPAAPTRVSASSSSSPSISAGTSSPIPRRPTTPSPRTSCTRPPWRQPPRSSAPSTPTVANSPLVASTTTTTPGVPQRRGNGSRRRHPQRAKPRRPRDCQPPGRRRRTHPSSPGGTAAVVSDFGIGP